MRRVGEDLYEKYLEECKLAIDRVNGGGVTWVETVEGMREGIGRER